MHISFVKGYQDYAAFQEEPEIEISRILKSVAERIESGEKFGFCFDINGNKIGSWNI